jgi:hypothetical protein
MKGDELKATIQLLSGYDVRSAEELRKSRPSRSKPCQPVQGLAILSGYRCVCNAGICDYSTCRLAKMHDHMPRHGKRASQHRDEAPL